MALALPVYDTQCGAKLFRATPLVARVFEEPLLARWVFDVEIIARYMALDPRGPAAIEAALFELPLTRWAHVPGSKVGPLDFARAALDLALHPRPPTARRARRPSSARRGRRGGTCPAAGGSPSRGRARSRSTG